MLRTIWCWLFHTSYYTRQGIGGYDHPTRTCTVPMHCVRCGRAWMEVTVVCSR